MRIYSIYITLPEELYRKLKKRMILIQRSVFHKENGKMSSLYAWTTDKSYAKEFISTHKKDYFYISKKDIDEDHWDDFDIEYSSLKLKPFEYIYNVKKEVVKIISTFEEYTAVCANFSEFKYELISDTLLVEPSIFKEKYYNALNSIFYVFEYRSRFILPFDNSDSFENRFDGVEVLPRYIHNELGLYAILFSDILE